MKSRKCLLLSLSLYICRWTIEEEVDSIEEALAVTEMARAGDMADREGPTDVIDLNSDIIEFY